MTPDRQRTVRRAALAVVALASVAAATAWPHWRETQALQHLLDAAVPAAGRPAVDCRLLRQERPLVLLVLGQSNAGNHGAVGSDASEASELQLVTPDGCRITGDPLPGATGHEASIWTRLPAALRAHGVEQPLVLGLLALDGLPARPWVDDTSPVRARLVMLVEAMRRQGLPPDFVLWQQGESDARLGTPAQDWQHTLKRLADLLSASGSSAPILLARSTACRSAADPGLHAAADALVAADPRFRPGADTDALLAPKLRRDGCHFSPAGLSAAAARWADRLADELAVRSAAPG